MGLSKWEKFSGKLPVFLLENALHKLDNQTLRNGETLKSVSPTAGFSWLRKTMREVSSPNLLAIVQIAFRNPRTKELANRVRGRLRATRFAPPQRTAENPHKRWNLIASSRLSGRAPEGTSNKRFGELHEMLTSLLRAWAN